jgi:asparagine synthase (glutamine-hydrolysing)
MCGIAGFVEPARSRDLEESELIVRRMASKIARRGPDDEGTWADPEAGVALGHRRLAILDLSEEGHQPMYSHDGRYVVVFNGEIYNFQALRQELEQRGHTFRGHSDTEVMLAAFCEWGVRAALDRFVGMFAFALWDRQTRSLHLARDRAGEKPLYYGWAGEALVFGSELKALQAYPEWNASVDRGALALLVRHGYIPAPFCIYENTYKLPPGCILTLNAPQMFCSGGPFALPEPTPYWSAQSVAEAGAAYPFEGSEEEASERLLTLLRQSVAEQMIADVPVGAFLSGGIDSSLVMALMQTQSGRPVKSFSIGFEQEEFNEAHFAKSVARHLRTDHTELYVQPRELQEVIPSLPYIYDEPFADPSQIPTAVLCRLASEQVKVSLSGDGGDELFGGYNRYQTAERLWKVIARIPKRLRSGLAATMKTGLHAFTSVEFGRLGRDTDAGMGSATGRRCHSILNRVSSWSEVLSVSNDRSLYHQLMSINRDPGAWLKDRREPITQFGLAPWEHLPERLQRMITVDLLTYLPDDILVKVDRAAMFVSLETRVPLLDHRLIEFACRLPTSFKQRERQGKWLLRQVLYRYVPRTLVDRPKRGFGAPIAEWLRGPLRDWAEQLLGEARLRQEGFFEVPEVRRKWREHFSRRRDWSLALWPVLMFQAWLEKQNSAMKKTARTVVKCLLILLYFMAFLHFPEANPGAGEGALFLSARIEV